MPLGLDSGKVICVKNGLTWRPITYSAVINENASLMTRCFITLCKRGTFRIVDTQSEPVLQSVNVNTVFGDQLDTENAIMLVLRFNISER